MAIKGKPDAIVNGQQTEQFKIHSSVLKDFIFNSNSQRTYNPGKINRTVSIRVFQKVKMPVEMEEDISKAGVTFYPESLEYIFQVEQYKQWIVHPSTAPIEQAANYCVWLSS